ncbi:MFS transporter [Oryzicola mucosus]|uniref:MFS transporter n=1 Tax=Oryzicola mucosus TaxID=2767425 RepID=A0A8J6PYT1_9HYPH|nr:MFS transporter [Oryzicola mucosus]MBD0413630.1 MFS transporter [Oryzicola mucosus]
MVPSSSLTAPLKQATFRNLWSATLVSNLGGLIQGVAAGWTMTMLTSSSDLVALVQAATTLPIMLFSIAAGALADSVDRRRVMLTAQTLMMAISIGLAVCAWQGLLTPWLLLAFTFLIGCGTALHNPSWQASMGDIVKREDIPSAVTLNSMAFNLMRSVGPAIGGLIVATVGAAAAFAVNAFTYIPLLAALTLWKRPVVKNTLPREALGSAMAAGLRYIAMSPNLIKVLFRGFAFGMTAIAVVALLPLVARDLVEGGALTYGIMLGCFGAGAIGGAFSNGWIRDRLQNETIVRCGFVGFAAAALLIAWSGQTWLTCLALVPAGACWVLTLSLFNVTVQLSTPRWVVGRALSLYQTATFGGMAGGAWLWGTLAEAHGVSPALVMSAVSLVAGAAIGVSFALPELGKLNLDPLDRFSEPILRLDLKPRSGPIMVMVDYEIAQEDVPAFLAAMSDRRRIRIRDGARQWALLRDLENPEIWTETYHVPTWVEYIRHNTRRTQADAESAERLRALHRGEQVRVHRMIERQTVPLHDDMPLKSVHDHPH